MVTSRCQLNLYCQDLILMFVNFWAITNFSQEHTEKNLVPLNLFSTNAQEYHKLLYYFFILIIVTYKHDSTVVLRAIFFKFRLNIKFVSFCFKFESKVCPPYQRYFTGYNNSLHDREQLKSNEEVGIFLKVNAFSFFFHVTSSASNIK